MGWISVRAPSHPYESTITRLRSERLQRRTGPCWGPVLLYPGWLAYGVFASSQWQVGVRWPGWSLRSASQIASTHNDRTEADQPRGRACCQVGLGEDQPAMLRAFPEPLQGSAGLRLGRLDHPLPGRLLRGDRGGCQGPPPEPRVGQRRAGCWGCKSCRAAIS
jgi:hypothetical protein